MSKHYEDWADWAGDHPEQAEAELKLIDTMDCEHAEVSPSGYCENCGIEVEGFEPDDAQLLTQSGTKEPAPIPVGVVSVHVLRTGVYAAINVREDVAERIRAGHVPGMSIGGAA